MIINARKLIYFILSPKPALLCGLFLCCGLFITNGVPFVYSDGYYYYHTARSIVDHGTFASEEKPEYFDYRGHAIIYYNGKYGEVTTPGGALFLTPGLFLSKLFRDPSQTVYNDYFLAFNGHTLLDGIVILITATLFAVISWVLMYRTLRKLQFAPRLAVFSVATTYASSYAVWYVFLSPAFTHTYELFSLALAVWGLLNYLDHRQAKFLVAVATGLGMLVLLRPIFAVIAIFVGVWLLSHRDWKGIGKLVLLGIPFLVIWLVYNYISYGSWLTSGYTEVRGELFTTSFNGHNVLLSPQRGWLVYSPVFAFAAAGIALLWKRQRKLALFSLATIVSIVTIYGFWPAWWGGTTFGQRFLILLTPLGAIGIAQLIDYIRRNRRPWLKPTLGIIVVCVLWSSIITLMYRFTPVATLRPQTDVVGNMQSSDRYTPLDMFYYHQQLVVNAQSIGDYAHKLYASAEGGTSLLALMIGGADNVIKVDESIPGKLVLRLIPPPLAAPSPPVAVKYYLVSDTGEAYTGKLSFARSNFTVTLNYSVGGWQIDPGDVTLETVAIPPVKISALEFVGIKLDKIPYQLFVERTPQLQIAGPKLSSISDFYQLP